MESTTETRQCLIDRFWETVPPMWNRIRGNVRGIVTEKLDITVEQFHVLRHIRKGSGSMSELAEAKQISLPAVSQAVDTLVRKGLVSRQQSTGDRRTVKLELTTQGDELLNDIFCMNRQWMSEKMADLSQDEMDCVLRALGILQKTFNEPNRSF